MSKLSDHNQLGEQEPTFVLRASDPLSGMMVRFWANANEKILQQSNPRRLFEVRELAAQMDKWRERNSKAG